MRKRFVLAFALLALLAASAGCSSVFGPGDISQQQLNKNATYDWKTSEDVTYNVTSGQYQAVYNLDKKDTLEIHQEESFGEEAPVEISGVQFQYPNGTVVGADQISVHKTKSSTIIRPPKGPGKLAYTVSRQGKTFYVPTYLEDRTYEVTIPRGMRVDTFLLSDVRPGSYETSMQDGREHIVWSQPVKSDSISVRYYLVRDKWIFAGIVALALLVGFGGLAYYRYQIRQLERQREEMGLNMDISDDDMGDGPPPGM
ncbi:MULTISPECIES: DUF5803 family protein [unclassified Haladaptatus]|uniref:DUF5803 family protein n=1 Tax=unclassified Haladaptatus TaxID=2622732 RepID=UPI00209C0646|nr:MULTISPECIES: DUF5803 family protein [unclassified Haladaptatus]MCO8243934.1 DUF5803 family protein [Haladaptatus sp. AB643]MCO8256469.1 DUF5803 family protein [Haladaptatus sp. AB618]